MNKRSVTIAGHRTSISLEEPFWAALHEVAAAEEKSVAVLVGELDRRRRPDETLSSAIRVYVLSVYRKSGPRTADGAPRAAARGG